MGRQSTARKPGLAVDIGSRLDTRQRLRCPGRVVIGKVLHLGERYGPAIIIGGGLLIAFGKISVTEQQMGANRMGPSLKQSRGFVGWARIGHGRSIVGGGPQLQLHVDAVEPPVVLPPNRAQPPCFAKPALGVESN